MLKDGTYSAWFKTPRGEGTGIVHFENGKISGGDSIMTYGGSYEVCGDRFTATVTTERHIAGHATVFGIDDLELKLDGVAKGAIARCTGTIDVAPGLIFEGTLSPCRSEPSPAKPERPAAKFDPSKLPKLTKRSRDIRAPQVQRSGVPTQGSDASCGGSVSASRRPTDPGCRVLSQRITGSVEARCSQRRIHFEAGPRLPFGNRGPLAALITRDHRCDPVVAFAASHALAELPADERNQHEDRRSEGQAREMHPIDSGLRAESSDQKNDLQLFEVSKPFS